MLICGQDFTPDLLRRIERVMLSEPALSRRALSRRICEWLDWRDACGQLKQMSCRVALRTLERRGALVLPAAKPWPGKRASNDTAALSAQPHSPLPAEPECLNLSALGRIELTVVEDAPAARQEWRALLDAWHYLGSGRPCGAQLRYLVHSEHRGLIGALGFAAPALKLAARDTHIGWSEAARRANLNLVVCNSRFLLTPRLKVKHLASHVLSQCLQRLPRDWAHRYGVRPALVETFVDPTRFRGTSYRAANWLRVGQTAGRGRQDRSHRCAVPVKDVFLYPLGADWQARLHAVPETQVSPARQAQPASEDWTQTEFGRAKLGDARLEARLRALARDFHAKPQAQIPQACGTRAKTKAAYRFFDHERTTMDAILESHYAATAERARGEAVVLAVQDTTSLNYNAQPAIENLGPIGTRADVWYGLLVHDTMAFRPDGVPLGLIDVQCWARDAQDFGKKERRKDVPIEQKESHKWLKSARAAAQLQRCCPDTTVVSVGDREADIFELFDAVRQLEHAPRLLIRAEHNRRLADEQGRLWDYMTGVAPAGTVEMHLAREHQRAARTALLDVSYARVSVKAPERLGKCEAVNAWAVLAKERAVSEGRTPLCWLLLTTCEVDSFEQASEKLRWYAQRWGIEVYHRTLKSGCRIETRQLGSAGRIQSCLAIDMVVAWRVLYLTHLGRKDADAPCTIYFEDAQWKALVSFVNRDLKLPDKPPTMREAMRMVAGLGGFLGRKGDGDPGAQTLWLGLQRLDDITMAFRVFSQMFGQPPPMVSSETYG